MTEGAGYWVCADCGLERDPQFDLCPECGCDDLEKVQRGRKCRVGDCHYIADEDDECPVHGEQFYPEPLAENDVPETEQVTLGGEQ